MVVHQVAERADWDRSTAIANARPHTQSPCSDCRTHPCDHVHARGKGDSRAHFATERSETSIFHRVLREHFIRSTMRSFSFWRVYVNGMFDKPREDSVIQIARVYAHDVPDEVRKLMEDVVPSSLGDFEQCDMWVSTINTFVQRSFRTLTVDGEAGKEDNLASAMRGDRERLRDATDAEAISS